MLRFKGIRIQPFNPRAMDSKTIPSTLYTLQNQAKEEEEEEESKPKDNEQEWTKHTTTKKFINIGSTTKVTITSYLKINKILCEHAQNSYSH